MRVTFATCDDFCAELERLSDTIWRKEVRVRIDRAPEQDDEVTFQVAIWGTAICRSGDGDFLLEYGELCGFDNEEQGARHPHAGSDEAQSRRTRIERSCSKRGLQILPGKFEAV